MRHVMVEKPKGIRGGPEGDYQTTSFICPQGLIDAVETASKLRGIRSVNLAMSMFFEWAVDRYEGAPKSKPMILAPPEIEKWTRTRTIYISTMLLAQLDRIGKGLGWTRGKVMVSLLQGYLKVWEKSPLPHGRS